MRGLKKDARRAIRKNNQITVEGIKLKNIGGFRIAWKNAVGNKRHVPTLAKLKALKKTFDKKAYFLLTEDNSAGAIFLIGDKLAYYWQAFTNKNGRKSLAQYKIVWEGILKLKASGVRILDFEGVYDDRFPNKSWRGFSHFKKSFGGDEIKYPGAYVKIRLLENLKNTKWKRSKKSPSN